VPYGEIFQMMVSTSTDPCQPALFVKEEEFPPMPPGALVNEEVVVICLPPYVIGGPNFGSNGQNKQKHKKVSK
jgi:hypothetical protein